MLTKNIKIQDLCFVVKKSQYDSYSNNQKPVFFKKTTALLPIPITHHRSVYIDCLSSTESFDLTGSSAFTYKLNFVDFPSNFLWISMYHVTRLEFLFLIATPQNIIDIQGGPYITANLYCICLSEHETWTQADAVQIFGNIWNAQ